MADIKTRDVVKGAIKKIDKAAIAADRMRSAYDWLTDSLTGNGVWNGVPTP